MFLRERSLALSEFHAVRSAPRFGGGVGVAPLPIREQTRDVHDFVSYRHSPFAAEVHADVADRDSCDLICSSGCHTEIFARSISAHLLAPVASNFSRNVARVGP